MNKADVFRAIVAHTNKGNEFMDTVPASISPSLFDNEWTDSICRINDLLMQEFFGEHYESVAWFLYDWTPGMEVEFEGVKAKIMDLEQYIDWMWRTEWFQ